MKPYLIGVAFLIALALSVTAMAEPPDIEDLSCPLSNSQPRLEFRYAHEVPAVGAGELEIATVDDTLTIVGRDKESLCFHLVTLARNFHTCGVMGVATKDGADAYLFRDGPRDLRIVILDDDHIQVEGGDQRIGSCGTNGIVETAVYTRVNGS